MSKLTNSENYGQAHLIGVDFQRFRDELSGIIVAPFNPGQAKGVGYNFSLSEMVYSITKKRLVTIRHNNNETYFYLEPQDTVLALSYEYLQVDDCIAGDFHSRVRMTAKGIGSTSTTVDPGWKGMLLFSLNNPTKKKIKIVLSTNIDGVLQQHTVLTLVARRTITPKTAKDGCGQDSDTSLHLENPPMRTDIWMDLTDKPLRLFRNKDYKRFQKLVSELSCFECVPSKNVAWSEPLKELLTGLEIAISANKDVEGIHEALIKIRSQENLPQSMKNRLKPLTECLSKQPDDGSRNSLLTSCSNEEYLNKIELARREIQYHLLTDQVEQIHALIKNNVPATWKKTALAFLWHHLRKNIGVILSSCYLLMLLCYGRVDGNTEFWQNFLLSFVPTFFSLGCSIFTEQK